MKMDADRGGPHPAGPGALAAAPTGRKGRRGRLLWVAPRWSAWRVLAWQVGIVVVGIASWQLAAQTHVIDPFFWSYPSKILDTFTTFVTTGKAYTDIWFTFRATLLGFVYGSLASAARRPSTWWR